MEQWGVLPRGGPHSVYLRAVGGQGQVAWLAYGSVLRKDVEVTTAEQLKGPGERRAPAVSMSGPRSSHLGPSGPVAKLTSTLAQGRTPQASLAAGEGFIPQQKEKYLLSCEVRLRPALPHKGRTLASGETDQLSSWSPLPPPHLHPVPFPLPSAHPILSSFPHVTGTGLYVFYY